MQSSRTFFDPALVEKSGSAFIREDKVDEALARLIPNVRITKGRFSCPGFAEQRDLVWNHMDQNHRPLIHRTYGEAMRMFVGERSAFSLTRFGGWPAVIPVFDGHYKDNGFYQILCLFGLIVVVVIIETNKDADGTRMDVDWAIASHKFLRFVHPILDRRLQRLNDVQNREDEQIRHRRVELRTKGYRFVTDEPDFLNSNAMANNVVFPPLASAFSVPIVAWSDGEVRQVDVGDRGYLVRRTGDAIEVWPAICPHEGAALKTTDLHGRVARCPWHGLEFGPRVLRPEGGPLTMCGAELTLVDGKLLVSPATVRPT